ncbi:MAG: hypothetical protein E6K24_15175 [Gammaproteobacteria bacterium]|nr:MAG: hypothetical protein E6K24_15175 [Gammaproteobacteria bacterium]
MARCCRAAGLALLACGASARAADWEASLDMRLLYSDAYRSFMDGGFGTTRFDRNDTGLRLGRARLALSAPLGELWSVHFDASGWDDKDRSPVGVTEAYLQFRPYPRAGYRFRLKAGAFYPPISLENRAAGWESPYTLSYSAINTWLGVETRTIGLEAQLDWLGTRTGHVFDLGVTGGVFGWNEGAGVVLADNGFMLHDRQTPVFGRVGPPGVGVLPFQQFDGRAGVYAGVEGRWLDRVVLRFLRYDNRADATSMDTVSGAIAWNTRFNSAGLRIESGTGWTGIVQWLQGETYIEPAPGLDLAWPFRAQFALLSKRLGRQTLSARYDRFEVDSNIPDGDGRQLGHAWTAAWMFETRAHWRLALEWLRVRSSSYNRAELGGPPLATETQLQLAVRYAFGSAVP